MKDRVFYTVEGRVFSNYEQAVGTAVHVAVSGERPVTVSTIVTSPRAAREAGKRDSAVERFHYLKSIGQTVPYQGREAVVFRQIVIDAREVSVDPFDD